MSAATHTLSAELNAQEAMALAQFVKRVGFSDARSNAANESEAYLMMDAFARIQRALAEQGFAPR